MAVLTESPEKSAVYVIGKDVGHAPDAALIYRTDGTKQHHEEDRFVSIGFSARLHNITTYGPAETYILKNTVWLTGTLRTILCLYSPLRKGNSTR